MTAQNSLCVGNRRSMPLVLKRLASEEAPMPVVRVMPRTPSSSSLRT